MLALVASIHVLNTTPSKEGVDGRDKPDHDGKNRSRAPSNAPPELPQRHLQMLTGVYEFRLIHNGLGKNCSPRMTRIFFKAETRPLPCLTNIALVEVA
jgi:hypothetical protein